MGCSCRLSVDRTLPSSNRLAQGCRTGSNGSGRVPTRNEALIEGKHPLSATSGGWPRFSRGAVSEKAGSTVSYLLRTARASRMA
eukprot:scaffold39726_cov50-Phaeocystis_antarctica.AAC.1